jgi:hypothetical protein
MQRGTEDLFILHGTHFDFQYGEPLGGEQIPVHQNRQLLSAGVSAEWYCAGY